MNPAPSVTSAVPVASGNASVHKPFQNQANPLDVLITGGAIVPADALAVIDNRNTHASGVLPATPTAVTQYLDVLGSR